MEKEELSKQEKLLNSAVSLIEEKGYDNTSISQIVQRAGLAQGTFYLYFSSKASLAPAIAEKIVQDTMNRGKEKGLDKVEKGEEFFQSLIDLVFEVTEEYQQIITFLYSGMSYYHSLERWEAIYEPYYRWLEIILKKLQNKGKLQRQPEASLMVQFSLGVIEHSAETCYLFKRKDGDIAHIKKELSEFILKGFGDNDKS